MSLRALILAPNGGWDLGYGGGTKVALCMANALAQTGYEVRLVALQAFPRAKLEEHHDMALHPMATVSCAYPVEGRLRRIPFPIGFRLLSRHAVRVIDSTRPDLLIFHDDAPQDVLRAATTVGAKTLLYVHFSYKVRSYMPLAAVRWHEENRLKQLGLFAYVRRRFADLDALDQVLANSSVTKRLSERFYPTLGIHVLYPPADLGQAQGPKDPIIFHAARRDRTFLEGMFFKACELLRDSSGDLGRFKVIVNRPGTSLARRLARNPCSAWNGGNLFWTSSYREVLPRCMFYAQFKEFEPFGISCVEAMSFGGVPLIYRSPTSGPWVDIAQRGHFGLGFSTAEEFVELTRRLGSDERERRNWSRVAARRSREFGHSRFVQRFRARLSGG